MVSSQLKGFFKAYSKWLKDGAESDEFRRCAGLCSSVLKYANMVGNDNMKMYNELKDLFKSEGLHENYPFNMGDADLYEYEMTYMSSHLNKERIAFVEKYAK
jgi:hypothetical protein